MLLPTLAFGFLLAGRPSAQVPAVTNGDFEEKGSKSDPIPGWTLALGASNGGSEPLSEISLDRRVRRSGKRSLHLSVDRNMFGMQIIRQEVEARPGGTYRLTAFARTENVHHETNAKGIRQFNNCYLAIFLFDGNGELVGRDLATPKKPYSDDWEPLSLTLQAPATVRRAEVKMFLSISGDLWFDDLELKIEGGQTIPEPAPVFRNDFEQQSELAPAWIIEEGARNGGSDPVSTIELDRRKGAGKSKGSMHLAGNKKTLLWQSANRYFEAAPGDVFHLSALVAAKKVHAEKNVLGIEQFANWHLRLVFFDEQGATLGAPRHINLDPDGSDWCAAEVKATAPEGSARGLAGVFLSMSGDVWLDDIELTRQTGGSPAYEGWQSLETEHLILRYPPDHPLAGSLTEYGARLETALASISSALEIPTERPITVYLYRDHAQGLSLTGRELAFAESERRAVHQDATNTPGHELAHVVALGLGYAQTGLLGEGLAVWLDGTPLAGHHQRAAKLLAAGELPSMEALLANFRAQQQGYPAAGSFCGWLLQTHGLDAVRRLYTRKDLHAAANAYLGGSMDSLDTAWRSFLMTVE